MFTCFHTYKGWIAVGAAALVGGYLVIWHGVHVAAALPFLVILACPLMHIFMHRRHGSHHGRGASQETSRKDE